MSVINESKSNTVETRGDKIAAGAGGGGLLWLLFCPLGIVAAPVALGALGVMAGAGAIAGACSDD